MRETAVRTAGAAISSRVDPAAQPAVGPLAGGYLTGKYLHGAKPNGRYVLFESSATIRFASLLYSR